MADCGQAVRRQTLLRRRTKPGPANRHAAAQGDALFKRGVVAQPQNFFFTGGFRESRCAPCSATEAFTCGWSMTISSRSSSWRREMTGEMVSFTGRAKNFIYHCAILSLQTKKERPKSLLQITFSSQLIWRCGQSDPELCWVAGFVVVPGKPVSRSCRSVRYLL